MCAIPATHVWYCMCTTCVEHGYYKFIGYSCIISDPSHVISTNQQPEFGGDILHIQDDNQQ